LKRILNGKTKWYLSDIKIKNKHKIKRYNYKRNIAIFETNN